jgi:hypothetical protein
VRDRGADSAGGADDERGTGAGGEVEQHARRLGHQASIW